MADLTKFKELIQKWKKLFLGAISWEIATENIKVGKGAIINDPIFQAFKNGTNLEKHEGFIAIKNLWYETEMASVDGNHALDHTFTLTLNELKREYLNLVNSDYQHIISEAEKTKGELTTAHELQKKAETAKETAETSLKTAQGDLKVRTEELKTANEKITKLEGEKPNEADKATAQAHEIGYYKLIAHYKEEIKKRTELFYQDLSLDNNLINEKYGNKDLSYILSKLTRTLNEKSDIDDIINAFRIVALITATEQAQIKSDEYKNIAGAKPPIKKMNLKRFNKVKDTWELISDESEPKEDNNPLYLAIIKDKNKYIDQINNIITLWQ